MYRVLFLDFLDLVNFSLALYLNELHFLKSSMKNWYYCVNKILFVFSYKFNFCFLGHFGPQFQKSSLKMYNCYTKQYWVLVIVFIFIISSAYEERRHTNYWQEELPLSIFPRGNGEPFYKSCSRNAYKYTKWVNFKVGNLKCLYS